MTRHETVRVAFVGAGEMANAVHYPSLASFEDVELVGICDIDEERLTKTADRYRVANRYTDYRRMVDATSPDAVYVIGQPHIMYDVWTWCLREGLNLCIEKPMGITLHQARALAYLAEKHDVVTQVSFQRRSSPMVSYLRDECLKRGPIVHAVSRFYKSMITPYLEARDHMLDDTVHSLDTVRWMCGGEIVAIESVTRRVQVPDINFIAAILRFDNGATGLIMNSWSSGRRVFAVEMHAPNICVEAEHEGDARLYRDGDTIGERFNAKSFAKSDQPFVYAGFQAKNREFIDAVKSGHRPPSHFGDALKTMEAAETILAQALFRGD